MYGVFLYQRVELAVLKQQLRDSSLASAEKTPYNPVEPRNGGSKALCDSRPESSGRRGMLIDEMRAELQKNYVSFAGFARLEGFGGDMAMHRSDNENVVLWSGMSREAVEAVKKILGEGEYEMRRTQMLVYAIDGRIPKLPIAHSLKRKYKKPHWLPVVFARVGSP